MLKISHQQIRLEFDGPTFSRGEQYFKDGRVEDFAFEVIDSDYVILRSRVAGSGNFYRQEISIEASGSFGIDIDGICSCPVGFNCKHIVAACLSYLTADSQPASQPDLKQRWLENMRKAGQPEAVIPDAEFVAYLLEDGLMPGELNVRYVECKITKKGTRTRGRKMNSYGGLSYERSATEMDKHIGRMLEAFKGRTSYALTFGISGDLGRLCLIKMIETNRCFWHNTGNPPLTLGESQPLQVIWDETENDQLKLDLKVAPGFRVLNFFPPFFLSEDESVIGPLSDAEFNAREWRLLREAPVLANEDAAAFSEQQLSLVPGLPIPLPGNIAQVDIVGLLPVPHLYLDTVNNIAGQNHRIRLRFQYGTAELSVFPQMPLRNVMENGQVLAIQRDLEAELAFKNRLHRSDLMQIRELSDDYWLKFGNEYAQEIPKVGIDAIDRWRIFLKETLPALESEGWVVQVADSFNMSFVEADNWEVLVDSDDDLEGESDNDWFNLRFDLEVQGKKYPLLPLITRVLQHYDLNEMPATISIALSANTFVELPAERIKPICNILYELYDRGHAGAGLAMDSNIRLAKYDAMKLAEIDQTMGTEVTWRGGKAMRKLATQLDNFEGISPVKTSSKLKATLRNYQQSGVDWLQFLRRMDFNGILADDMGLGKTVQVLAHLQIEKEQKRMDRPCLIIAPTSLMSNWRREVEQFTPNLSVLILQGSDRHKRFKLIDQHDLIITTYPLLVRDKETLLACEYHYVVLDEAQVIKNHKAKASQLVRQLKTRHRLCMTGTPMENHLGELWAQFDFLMPGFLADVTTFRQRFRTPIETHGDHEQHARLAKRIAPFLLRRRKVDVATELPAKTEIIRTVTLGKEQAALYESIRLSMEKKVRDAISARGLARSHITILDALLKLRQTCCDPQLLSLKEAKTVKASAKLELLMELLPEMLEEGRRILLFSQFTTMLGIIEDALVERGIEFAKLTGQTRKRDDAIERFRSGAADVFLISLKAGGVGLNLTEADTVIHYDPWWNPAAENQATDRAHRIGQDKPVFVYKLITENTLEEKILDMQARKQELADASFEIDHEGEQVRVTPEDLRALFTPIAEASS